MLSSMWAYITLLVGSAIAAAYGWIKYFMLERQLRNARANNVILDSVRMEAESKLRATIQADQLLHEQESKLRAQEIEVQNAAIANPCDNLNGAIKGK